MARKGGRELDVSPLIRTVQYLEEVLKRGIVVGVEDDTVVIKDAADVNKALTLVQARIADVHRDMIMLLRDAQKAQCVGIQ